MTYTFDINDCDMINNNVMIEHDWHKLLGYYNPAVQSPIVDAAGVLMNNPTFVIDIYFKLIAARTDNLASGFSEINPNGYATTDFLQNFGFTMSFYSNGLRGHAGGYIEQPQAPFTLPPMSQLTDGYNLQFPVGEQFVQIDVNTWQWNTDNPVMGYGGSFLNVAGQNTNKTTMLSDIYLDQNNQVYTVDIDVSQFGLGIPFIEGDPALFKKVMPKLFTGFVGVKERKWARGVVYCCLGVHHI